MIFDTFSDSFYSFMDKNIKIPEKEKDDILYNLKNKTIRTVISISLYLVIWSFVVAFIDATLFTRGTIRSFLHFSIFGSFLPSLIFILINAIVKYGFIYFYSKKKNIEVDKKHIFIGIIPIVGSFFFTAYLLKKKPFLSSVILKYLKYIKKKFRWIEILKEHKKKL